METTSIRDICDMLLSLMFVGAAIDIEVSLVNSIFACIRFSAVPSSMSHMYSILKCIAMS